MDPSITFADFWLAGDDRWRMTTLCRDHGKAQAEFLLSSQGCLAVDYVANLDNATGEWPRILDMIGSSALKKYEEEVPFMQPESGNVFGTNTAAEAGVANGRELVEQDAELERSLREE